MVQHLKLYVYIKSSIVYENGNNLSCRGKMLVGSCGWVSLKGLGFVHAISHMVGAELYSTWINKWNSAFSITF